MPSASSASSSSSSSSASPPPDPLSSLPSYLDVIQSSLVPANRFSASLPKPEDLSFHRSLDRKFGKRLDQVGEKVLGLLNTLLGIVEGESDGKASTKKRLEGEDAVVDRYDDVVVDVVDGLLERADLAIDEYLGKLQRPAAGSSASSTTNRRGPTTTATFHLHHLHNSPSRSPTGSHVPPSKGRLPASLMNAQMPRPQLRFNRKPDNSEDSMWTPLLRATSDGQVEEGGKWLEKVNAMVPLGWVDDSARMTEEEEGDQVLVGAPNPYAYEIRHVEYPSALFTSSPPMQPSPVASTPFKFISTPTALHTDLLPHLLSPDVREIAIDLEHHDYRSYQGFVCLMQISTRNADWIVDCLVPEVREQLGVLNKAFTDPGKIKVFHGAESDILWLQRDFGLYIVNLFDTYHATKVLTMPSHSLASLLALYCDFDADKRYQLADWRVRPLPEEMVFYARMDTHALLFVYDRLREELLDRGAASSEQGEEEGATSLMREVLRRSEGTAERVYVKERWDEEGERPGGWKVLWRKWGRPGGDEGRVAWLVRALHRWRDRVAREEDESVRYILPNHHLLTLAQKAPTSANAVVASVQSCPSALRSRSVQVASLIEREVEAWQEEMRLVEQRRTKVGGNVPRAGASSTPASGGAVGALAAVQSSSIAATVVESLWSPLFADAEPSSHIQDTASTAPPIALRSSLFGAALDRSTQPTMSTSTPMPAAGAATTAIRASSNLFGSLLQSRSSKAPAPPPLSSSSTAFAAVSRDAKANAEKLARITRDLAKLYPIRDLSSTLAASATTLAKRGSLESESRCVTGSTSSASSMPAAVSMEREKDEVMESLPEPETVPFVPKERRMAGSSNTSSRVASAPAHGGKGRRDEKGNEDKKSEEDDEAYGEVVQVAKIKDKKKEKDKKRKLDDLIEGGGAENTTGQSSGASGTPNVSAPVASSSSSSLQSSSSPSMALPLNDGGEGVEGGNKSKKKKRKDKEGMNSREAPSSMELDKGKSKDEGTFKATVEPFDYSKVKSVLDAPPPAPLSRRKDKKEKAKMNTATRKREEKKKAAPRNMTEPKSGNRSRTFG